MLCGLQYKIVLAFWRWLIFICTLCWPTSLPCSLCYCDTYFPSWGSIKSYHVSSYLIYLCTAGDARQTLMELQKTGWPLCIRPHFAQRLLKGFYHNEDAWFSSVKKQTASATFVSWVAVYCQRVIVLFAQFIYFISVSCCYKFIIHSWLSIVHTLLLCPYNPVSMTTRISSIRPGGGMICELHVKSYALSWTLSPSLFHLLTFNGHPHETHIYSSSQGQWFDSSYFQGHPNSWRSVISPSHIFYGLISHKYAATSLKF